MPRKSKGRRKEFMTRLPLELADVVETEAKSRGLSYSEYLAITVARAHGDSVPLPPRSRPVLEQMTIGDAISA